MRRHRTVVVAFGLVVAVASLLPSPAVAAAPEQCLLDAVASGSGARQAIASCLGEQAAETAAASTSSTDSSFCYLIPTLPWASQPVTGVGDRMFIVYGLLIFCDEAIAESIATYSLQTSTDTTLDTRTGRGTPGAQLQTVVTYGVCPTRMLAYRTRVEVATVTTQSLTTHNFLFQNGGTAVPNCWLI